MERKSRFFQHNVGYRGCIAARRQIVQRDGLAIPVGQCKQSGVGVVVTNRLPGKVPIEHRMQKAHLIIRMRDQESTLNHLAQQTVCGNSFASF